MRISLVLRAAIIAIALIGWMAAPALAAPLVLSSDPEAGAEMHEPPAEVTIEFSEPLQASSGMSVTDSCGNKVSEGEARIVGPANNELNVVLGDTPYKGTYTVKYVGTGVTGTSTGSFDFVVHGGTNCDGTEGGRHDVGQHDGGQNGGGDHEGAGGSHGEGGGGQHDSNGGSHSGGRASHPMRGGDTMSGESHDSRPNRNTMGHKRASNNGEGMGHGDGQENPPLAGPTTLQVATDLPTGSTVVISLGLAIAMGLIGGWVLRVSSPS